MLKILMLIGLIPRLLMLWRFWVRLKLLLIIKVSVCRYVILLLNRNRGLLLISVDLVVVGRLYFLIFRAMSLRISGDLMTLNLLKFIRLLGT